MQKRGQAVSVSKAPALLLMLGLAILIAAASSLAITSFRQTRCTGHWDGVDCYNNASKNYRIGDYAANVSFDGDVALQNWSGQIGTVGTVLGVALIIVVVVGAFGLFGRGGGGL